MKAAKRSASLASDAGRIPAQGGKTGVANRIVTPDTGTVRWILPILAVLLTMSMLWLLVVYFSARHYGTVAESTVFVPATDERAHEAPMLQHKFVAVVQETRVALAKAADDIEAADLRWYRNAFLCRLLSDFEIRDWTGSIQGQLSKFDGSGAIRISIGKEIDLATLNNIRPDAFGTARIPVDSDLFQQLSRFDIGDRVEFSGRFVGDETSCIREGGYGGDRRPAFIISLLSIRKG